MQSTKIECKDCKEYKDCSDKDGQGDCPMSIFIQVINQLLGN